jgi:aryl-alcohol dehydrogenase-like predicted oxidoreductase
MKRRAFVAAAAAAGLSRGQAAGAAKPGGIPMRVFGKTGQKLTVIGQAGGRFPLINDEDAVAVTRRAVELGINYFDTAAVYWNGHSEEIYGRVLPAVRKQIFLTTKSTNRTRQGAAADLEASLKRLKTDYVDLWQVHSIESAEDAAKVFAPGGAIEAFEEAKRAGKCRFIGFTGHRDPYAHLEMLKRYDKWDTILMPLHIADPLYLSFEKLVLPAAIERNLGIQGMKNFANAKLLQTFSVRECLSYVLSLPVHCTAIGCTTIGQLEDDVRAARDFRPLDPTRMAALRKRAEGIKGPLLEDWKKNVDAKLARVARPEYAGG